MRRYIQREMLRLHSWNHIIRPSCCNYDIVFINGAGKAYSMPWDGEEGEEGVDPFPWGWSGVLCLSGMLRKFFGIWL